MHTQQRVHNVCTVSVCAVWAVLAECVVGTECTVRVYSMCGVKSVYSMYRVQLFNIP